MCGIAGALDLTGTREFSARRLLAMTGAIAHRGPDDEQIHIEPGVALGARRLSIVDLAGGRQPIANEDGSVWVAFNGELFEYPELRRSCWRAATAWPPAATPRRGSTSTRTVGEAMFAKARGQFAVSLWDRNDRTLILGRDRVGICPLYYAERDGWLLWGSEVKALLASGLVAARPDPRGDRPPLHLLLRGDDADVLRGGQVAPARAFPAGQGRPGRAQAHVLGPRLPRRRPGAAARRPDAAGRRARGAACGRRSSAGCGATCRSSATSAAGSIRRSCSA